MSIWAAVKHALNSTLGTSDFKSLDKLITEQTRMVASDTPYITLPDINLPITLVNQIQTINAPTKIKMTRGGTCRFTGTVGRTTYTKMSFQFSILNGSSVVYYVSQAVNSGSGSESFSADISFKPGDIISFQLLGLNNTSSSNARSVYVTDFKLCGTVEHNVLEVLE